MAPKLVLDTNAFRSLSDERLDAIAARGFRVSVSEVAFTETWARSVRDYKEGKPRREARGQFYGRARKLNRYIDDEYPVALIGRPLIERLRRQLGHEDPPGGPDRFATFVRAQWRTVVGVGHTDEEWVASGEQHGGWLAEVDEDLRGMARRDDDLWENARLRGSSEEELARMRETWAGWPDEHQLEATRVYLLETWGFAGEMAERMDAHARTTALRLHLAARGEKMPAENDGADLRLMHHLAEGFIVITNDKRLLKLVEHSGSVQRPWVRRVEDLDGPLPDGAPWGTTHG